MKLLVIIVIIFIAFGAFSIVKYNNYKLDNPGEAISFFKDFGKWMFHVGSNTKDVVGYAFNKTWLPENDSDGNKSINKTG